LIQTQFQKVELFQTGYLTIDQNTKPTTFPSFTVTLPPSGWMYDPKIPQMWFRRNLTVFLENQIFVFEFKVIELTEKGSVLEQIKKKKYYEKYITASTYDKYSLHRRDKFEKLERENYLISIEFYKLERNITNFEGNN
jgi:hypothetical protein